MRYNMYDDTCGYREMQNGVPLANIESYDVIKKRYMQIIVLCLSIENDDIVRESLSYISGFF